MDCGPRPIIDSAPLTARRMNKSSSSNECFLFATFNDEDDFPSFVRRREK